MIEVKLAKIGYINSVKGSKKETVIFEDLSCNIEKGKLYCILGANGIGKTTLFRTILGFIPILGGEILIDDKSLAAFSRKELSRKIAYVPQYHTPPFPYSVMEIVLMGRGAYIDTFSSPSQKDILKAENVLKKLDILHLKDSIYTRLSGGERQLVLIARALVQETDYLFMDEPGANLDYGNQIKMLKILKELSDNGIGICFTTHSPEHAILCNANVISVSHRGRLVQGTAKEVIGEELLKDMYGIDTVVKVEKVDDEYRQIIMPVFH